MNFAVGEKYLLRIGSIAALGALSLWTVAKGLLPMFETDEVYFWLITYETALFAAA